MKKIVLLLAIILFAGCNDDDKLTSPNRFKGCEVVSKSSFINARMRLKLTDSLSVVYDKDYITIRVPAFEASKYHCGDVIR